VATIDPSYRTSDPAEPLPETFAREEWKGGVARLQCLCGGVLVLQCDSPGLLPRLPLGPTSGGGDERPSQHNPQFLRSVTRKSSPCRSFLSCSSFNECLVIVPMSKYTMGGCVDSCVRRSSFTIFAGPVPRTPLPRYLYPWYGLVRLDAMTSCSRSKDAESFLGDKQPSVEVYKWAFPP
jgi:hypothetical protein